MPPSSENDQRALIDRVIRALESGSEPDEADAFALRGMASSSRERAMPIAELAQVILARLGEKNRSGLTANSGPQLG
jgi:hypothetical protein